jgi:hypothetical protein
MLFYSGLDLPVLGLRPGMVVRVKPGVSPKFGWGSVTASSVGILTSCRGTRCVYCVFFCSFHCCLLCFASACSGRVAFKEQASWSCHLPEMDVITDAGALDGGRIASLVALLPPPSQAIFHTYDFCFCLHVVPAVFP